MNALRRPSTAVNALLVLLIAAAGLWSWTLLRDASGSARASAAGVRTVTVTQGTVTRTVSADGAVASAATATATFTTPGTVTAIKVKVGDVVGAGALLARVDPAGAERDLELARADLAAAEDALDRAANAGADTGPAADAVTEAELAVDEAEAAVAGTKLKAPAGGTVIAVNGSLGGPGTTDGSGFVDLADLTRLQITAGFPEAGATELQEGQSATITWNALDGAESTGEVTAVAPTATSEDDVVTYGVTVSLPDPPEDARPGQTVTVSVVTGSVENTVMVDAAAVTSAGGRKTVTVLGGDGKPEIREVEVGLEGDDAYQITAGLAPGERVVVPARGPR
ncbi:efflux RND transporter periplasmic adaptor subunit [Actinoplanes flavus]|uniref:Efflux RND transporter periplasmic adaptor subunit n=1 Tax=Actinoplanes flavus TaxID=2820290 RepID=A0ABS3UQZ7_9ACTN|nr:efflux RND transporter periplasmic adaptor subunit [Actinoplanes flavus]MBO3741200.1 efflux RND transporter periplasmic adaptor subunit [Actinoplanes flavus]